MGDQVSVISSEKQKKGGGLTHQLSDVSRLASTGWHADITFEPVPSDYAALKIHTLPETGGDTVCGFQITQSGFYYRNNMRVRSDVLTGGVALGVWL